MSCVTTNAKILLRRDTSANWTSTNPILANGEQGYETNTGKMKIGDGVRNWSSLPYFTGSIAATIFLDAGKPDTSYVLCPTLELGGVTGTTDTSFMRTLIYAAFI
jgi:hypothetical protein